jgi:hypothetical protein
VPAAGLEAREFLRDRKLVRRKEDDREKDESLRRGGEEEDGGVKELRVRSAWNGVNNVLSGITCLQNVATYRHIRKSSAFLLMLLTLLNANLAGVVNVNRGST